MDFNKSALTWDDNPERVRRTQIIAQQIEKFLPQKTEMTALEIGNGTGMLSFLLKDKFEKITLLDTSESMIDVIRQKISTEGVIHFHPLTADIFDPNTKIPVVDVIYLSMVLHHIVDLERAFAVFHEHLLPGGMLFIADLVTEDGSFHEFTDEFVHKGFSHEQLNQLITDAGVKEVDYKIALNMRKETSEGEKFFPIFLVVAQKL